MKDDIANIRELVLQMDDIELKMSTIIDISNEVVKEHKELLEKKEKLSLNELSLLKKMSDNRVALEESFNYSIEEIYKNTDDYNESFSVLLKEIETFTKIAKNYEKKIKQNLLKKISFASIFTSIGFGISHFEIISNLINYTISLSQT